MALGPDGLREQPRGHRITADEFNAIVAGVRAAIGTDQHTGFADAGLKGDKASQRAVSAWYACRVLEGADAIEPYSVFCVSAVDYDGDAGSGQLLLRVAPAGIASLSHGSPLQYFTNGSREISAEYAGYCRPINAYDVVEVRATGDNPKIGDACGPTLDGYTVETGRVGFVRVGGAMENRIRVLAIGGATAVVGTLTGDIVADTGEPGDDESCPVTQGQIAVDYRAAGLMQPATNPTLNAGPWLLPVWATGGRSYASGDQVLAVPVAGVGLQIVDSWTCAQCYELTLCPDQPETSFDVPIRTGTNLAAYVGKVIRIEEYPEFCFTVSKATECTGAQDVTVFGSSPDCDSCGACYYVQPCNGSAEAFPILNDLAAFADDGKSGAELIGRAFLIDGECHVVTAYQVEGCEYSELVIVEGYFPDCTYCGCVKIIEAHCEGSSSDSSASPEIRYINAAERPGGAPFNLRDYIGAVFRDDGGKLWTIDSIATDCDSTGGIVVLEVYADCDSAKCFELTSCDAETTATTYTDLYGMGYELGDVFFDTISEACYTISAEVAWDEAAGSVLPEEGKYETCEECNAEIVYMLTATCNPANCEELGSGEEPETIYTRTRLKKFDGMYAKHAGGCFAVNVYEGSTGEIEDLIEEIPEPQGPFPTCDACLAAPTTATVRLWQEVFVRDNSLWQYYQDVQLVAGAEVSRCGRRSVMVVEGDECSGS